MATERLTAVFSSASPGGAWPASAGNQTTAVAPPDDDASSFISHSTTLETITYAFTNPVSFQDGDTVTDVILTLRGLSTPDFIEPIPVAISAGGSTLNTSVEYNDAANYADKTISMPLDPDSNDWTEATFAALQTIITSLDSTTTRITSIYVDIEYIPAGGSTLHTVPMMGAGLL